MGRILVEKDVEAAVKGGSVYAAGGGGWAGGKKDDLKDAIREAARKGYVAVSVGYRLAPQNLFPAPVE